MTSLPILAVILGLMLAGVRAGKRECRTGGVCCSDCPAECPQQTIACYSNCKSPCLGAKDCVGLGSSVSQGVAVAACEQAKKACKVPITSRTSLAVPSLDLKTCCQVIIGSCAGNAALIPCNSRSYGICTKTQFEQEYGKNVATTCKSAICQDAFCQSELTGSRWCS